MVVWFHLTTRVRTQECRYMRTGTLILTRLIATRASLNASDPISIRDETMKKMKQTLCNEHGRKPLRRWIRCHSVCDISTFIRYYCQFMDNENSMTCRKPATSVHQICYDQSRTFTVVSFARKLSANTRNNTKTISLKMLTKNNLTGQKTDTVITSTILYFRSI